MSRSPRKHTASDSHRNSEPKRKATRSHDHSRRRDSSQNRMPFTSEDEFSDVVIKVGGGKNLYSNKCLLSYNSPVLMKQFADDSDSGGGNPGKGGKGSKTSSDSKGKESLDLSKWNFEDVCEFLSFLDPRVEYVIKDDDAIKRLLPFADEYDVKQLLHACETAVTDSFNKRRQGRRPGYMPLDVALDFLKIADKHDFKDLSKMCIDECVANDNPFGNRTIADCKDISEATKVHILDRKVDKLSTALRNERRSRTGQNEAKSKDEKVLWRT